MELSGALVARVSGLPRPQRDKGVVSGFQGQIGLQPNQGGRSQLLKQ